MNLINAYLTSYRVSSNTVFTLFIAIPRHAPRTKVLTFSIQIDLILIPRLILTKLLHGEENNGDSKQIFLKIHL